MAISDIERGMADLGAGIGNRIALKRKLQLQEENKKNMVEALDSLSQFADKSKIESLNVAKNTVSKLIEAGAVNDGVEAIKLFSTISEFEEKKKKPADETPQQKALREAQEQTGLKPEDFDIDKSGTVEPFEIGKMKNQFQLSQKTAELKETEKAKAEIKLQSEQKEKETKGQIVAKSYANLMQASDKIRADLEKKYPTINEATPAGQFTRKSIALQQKVLQTEPAVNAFNKYIKTEAYKTAVAMEGRVTQDDVAVIYESLFKPLGRPSSEELALSKLMVSGWFNKKEVPQNDPVAVGLYNMINAKSNDFPSYDSFENVDSTLLPSGAMIKIKDNFARSYQSEEDAENDKDLKNGEIIVVNGQAFKWQNDEEEKE